MAKKPTAAIYFSRHSNEMAKDLADRVRNDGPKTILVWGEKFRSETDIEEDVGAVIIQRSLHNSAMIATVYEQFAASVEIHYVTDDGDFEEELEAEQPHPRAAVAEPEAEPEAPTEPEAVAPDEQPAAEVEGSSDPDQPIAEADATPEEPADTPETSGGTPPL